MKQSAGMGCLILGFILWTAGPSLAAAKDVQIMEGKLTGIQGVVEVKKTGSDKWVEAKEGMTIRPGDAVACGIDGKAKLAYENSVSDIEPLAQFVVGRAAESDNQYMTEIFLQVGKIKSDVAHVGDKKNRFSVVTPAATAGVRGTIVECAYTPGLGAEMSISEGAGFTAPVNPDALPAAVQMVLGIGAASAASEAAQAAGAPAGGAPSAAAMDQAFAAMAQWIGSFEQGIAAMQAAGPAGPGAGGAEAPAGMAPPEGALPPGMTPEAAAAMMAAGGMPEGMAGMMADFGAFGFGDAGAGFAMQGFDVGAGMSAFFGAPGEAGGFYDFGGSFFTGGQLPQDGTFSFENFVFGDFICDAACQAEHEAQFSSSSGTHDHTDPSQHTFPVDHDGDGHMFDPSDPGASNYTMHETLANDQDATKANVSGGITISHPAIHSTSDNWDGDAYPVSSEPGLDIIEKSLNDHNSAIPGGA